MDLDPDVAYQALANRDAHFDGRLFVGVTSTRIYCRPICRVRTPSRRNCRFFETAVAAEGAGFRPCLKCRPEIAPGRTLPWTLMDASRTLALQAAQAFDAGLDDAGEVPTVAAVAARLGVSDRHLRRIFRAEHGVGPLQYVQTRRLLLAKHLLTDTPLTMAQVALASGFRSLRRFNAAVATSYRMTPQRLRRSGVARVEPARLDSALTLTLAYRVPYDDTSLLRFFARRALVGVERVDADGVRRSLAAGIFGPEPGWIEARIDTARAEVRVRFAPSLAPASRRVVDATRRWFDLDASPATIEAALVGLPGPPGLRLPGCIDAFEMAARTVLGQQVTVVAARTLAARLVRRFGTPVVTPWPDIDRAFPTPASLAGTEPASMAELGIVGTRAAALGALARDWPALVPLMRPGASPSVLIERLCRIRGIGAWTAHAITMRGLGWSDAYPPGDVAVLRALQQGRCGVASARDAEQLARTWQPWRSYAVLRLWNTQGEPA